MTVMIIAVKHLTIIHTLYFYKIIKYFHYEKNNLPGFRHNCNVMLNKQ